MKTTIEGLRAVVKEVRANFWPMTKGEENTLVREAKVLSRTYEQSKSEWDLYEVFTGLNRVKVGGTVKVVLSPQMLLFIVDIRILTSRHFYDGAAFCPGPFWLAWGFRSERHALGIEYRHDFRSDLSDQAIIKASEEVISSLPELEIRVFNKLMSDSSERAAFVAECCVHIHDRNTCEITVLEDNGDDGEPRTPLQLAKKIVGYNAY